MANDIFILNGKSYPKAQPLARKDVIKQYKPYVYEYNPETKQYRGTYKDSIVGWYDIVCPVEYDTEEKALEYIIDFLKVQPVRMQEWAAQVLNDNPDWLTEFESKHAKQEE